VHANVRAALAIARSGGGGGGSGSFDPVYGDIPPLEQVQLPRGGVSVTTAALAGPVQFGIPPETIKDSMRLGLPVPEFYIVPVERFCRDLGPSLGVNLAEFEFPAYFNFFVRQKNCTLIVDSERAEEKIRAGAFLAGERKRARRGGGSMMTYKTGACRTIMRVAG
jgi:hypothetical protein